MNTENGGIIEIDKAGIIGLPQQLQWQKGEQVHSSLRVREWSKEITEAPGVANEVKSLHVSYDNASM